MIRRCKEKCIADGTYRNRVFVNAQQGNPRPLSDLIRAVKARHETVNSRFKKFAMFRQLRGFRHDKETHGIYFHAIANLIQIELEIESPLFDLHHQLDAFDRYYKRYCQRYYQEQYRHHRLHR